MNLMCKQVLIFLIFYSLSPLKVTGLSICYGWNTKTLGYCPNGWYCCPGTDWCCSKDTVCTMEKGVKCIKYTYIYRPFVVVMLIFMLIFLKFVLRLDFGRRKARHATTRASEEYAEL